MRHTIYKWFWAWNFDKEEKWLNEMATQGLHLVAVGFCKYTFEEGMPGEYCVRMELLNDVPTHPKSRRYINFIEDTGAEYIGSIMRWTYFRKKTGDGGFNLFSDIDSRIVHLKRILFLIGVIGAMELYVSAFNGFLLFAENGSTLNLATTVLGSMLSIIIVYGFLRTYFQYRSLKKERLLHE